jgi:hypothetical protein
MLVGSGALESKADAQGVPIGPGQQPQQRFQISAWAYPGRDSSQGRPNPTVADNAGQRGCYIVDTVTGQLWHAAADGQAKKIGEKLN